MGTSLSVKGNAINNLSDLGVNLGHPGHLLTRIYIISHTLPLSLWPLTSRVTLQLNPSASASASSLSWRQEADFLRNFSLPLDISMTHFCFPSCPYSKIPVRRSLKAVQIFKTPFLLPSSLLCFFIFYKIYTYYYQTSHIFYLPNLFSTLHLECNLKGRNFWLFALYPPFLK